MNKHVPTAALLAVALATGLAACSHDKTKPDETAMNSPSNNSSADTAAANTSTPTPVASGSSSDTTVASSTGTETGASATSPTVDVAAMESTNQSSADQSQKYETSNNK